MLRQWEAHTTAEFITRDLDATMRTMSDNPTVLHLPTGMGGVGLGAVRSFYSTWFVGRNPADLEIKSISQTAGEAAIVDEMVVSFTHDSEVPWILPGVPATGKRVIIPVIRGPRTLFKRDQRSTGTILVQSQIVIWWCADASRGGPGYRHSVRPIRNSPNS
jgi:carboxymethylenebutenolidase